MKGFTIFFAMLVGSLALAIGLAIYDLTVRELDLSSTASQSQYAIYAADTGAECALYWDFKCPDADGCAISSAFATSTSNKWNGRAFPPTTGIICNSVPIPVTPEFTNPAAATTTFTFQIPSGGVQTYCTSVTVAKSGTPIKTTITSKGYNAKCPSDGAAPNRLERVLYVNY